MTRLIALALMLALPLVGQSAAPPVPVMVTLTVQEYNGLKKDAEAYHALKRKQTHTIIIDQDSGSTRRHEEK